MELFTIWQQGLTGMFQNLYRPQWLKWISADVLTWQKIKIWELIQDMLLSWQWGLLACLRVQRHQKKKSGACAPGQNVGIVCMSV